MMYLAAAADRITPEHFSFAVSGAVISKPYSFSPLSTMKARDVSYSSSVSVFPSGRYRQISQADSIPLAAVFCRQAIISEKPLCIILLLQRKTLSAVRASLGSCPDCFSMFTVSEIHSP